MKRKHREEFKKYMAGRAASVSKAGHKKSGIKAAKMGGRRSGLCTEYIRG